MIAEHVIGLAIFAFLLGYFIADLGAAFPRRSGPAVRVDSSSRPRRAAPENPRRPW